MKIRGAVSRRLAAVVLVSLAACGLVSCSEIFNGGGEHDCHWGCGAGDRSYAKLYSSGFSPQQSSPAYPDSCDGVGEDGQMRVRFVVVDNDGRPIRLGEAVAGQDVSLDAESVEFSNTVLMAAHDGPGCTSDSDCSPGFTCGVAPGLDTQTAEPACLRPDDGLVVDGADGVRFISDTDDDQVFGVLVENSGSVRGWQPPGASGAWDRNADGDTSDADDAEALQSLWDEGLVTDPDEQRWVAALRMAQPLADVAELAQADDRDTLIGLWMFDEANPQPASIVEAHSSSESNWTSNLDLASQAIREYLGSGEPNSRNARANVYESIENTIEAHYSTEAMERLGLERPEGTDKQLVVFVDGYDDMRENDNSTLDSVIEAAVDNHVRLFIVHLDPELDEPELLRDDPMYPTGQEPCSQDADCKDFERCARPRGYAPSKGEATEVPAGANYDLAETYCLPERDASGRSGPIDDYAKMACATGGSYIYVKSVEEIDDNMSWLPYALEGLWEARVVSSQISRGEVFKGPLRVHTDMSVSVAGMTQTYQFRDAAEGAQEGDTRGVVFTR